MMVLVATVQAVLALLCSSVLAIPPPAFDQHPFHPVPAPQPRPSRWSSLSNRLVEALFGHAPPQKESRVPSKEQQVPAHALARYGGDLVLRFNVTNNEEAASLAEAADTLLLDVWEYSRDWVDIRLSKDSVPLLLGLLTPSLQDAHTPLLRESALAQAILDSYQKREPKSAAEPPSHLPTRRPFSPDLDQAPSGAETNIFFADYQPFSVIEPWMRLLASLFTTHVRLVNIGLSYEGRNIPALRVGVHPTNDEDPARPRRKTILIVGSLHAREWISTTTVNYVAYSLITGYGKLQSVTRLLEKFDFVFIPTLNPDGYIYTWETDRLWRKNRQQTGIRFCQGIDLDRSFVFEWSGTDNPCSESFAGDAPFEAVEAKALATWAQNETSENNVDFVGFLDLHSYSQEILYPYSYSCRETPPGLENLEEVAYGLGKAIRVTHGHAYEIMPACEGNVARAGGERDGKKLHLTPRMELAGGSALDYFYNTIGVRYAYQIKLRDRGAYGFLLPKEDIVPTGKEILNAVLYLGRFLGELYDQDDSPVKLTKSDMKVDEASEADGRDDEKGEEDPWVMVEDAETVEFNWELRRRRKR